MDDFNPYLRPWTAARPSARGGAGSYESYGPELKNIPWQTRAAAPTAYENELADAMEKAFDEGVTELPALVKRLNQLGVQSTDGQPWTDDSLQAELRRLGA
jgi:hypothetical protein